MLRHINEKPQPDLTNEEKYQMPNPNPKLNGQIFYITGQPEIYWIDNGLARHIPDEATYHGVFGGSPNKQAYEALLTDVTLGSPIADGTELVRAGNDAMIYFVENKTKRWIPTETIKARYQLNGNVHSMPSATVSSFATGSDFVDPGGPPTLRSITATTATRIGSPAATTITVRGTGFTPKGVIVIRFGASNFANPVQFSTVAGPDGTLLISDTIACVAGIGITVSAFEDADPANTTVVAPNSITC
jgi:hypothetical protein